MKHPWPLQERNKSVEYRVWEFGSIVGVDNIVRDEERFVVLEYESRPSAVASHRIDVFFSVFPRPHLVPCPNEFGPSRLNRILLVGTSNHHNWP